MWYSQHHQKRQRICVVFFVSGKNSLFPDKKGLNTFLSGINSDNPDVTDSV